MTAIPAFTWRGRRGSVLLGPTEDRVARYLADATRHGRVTIRTVELGERLSVERSEIYRVTARLRVLGLFGIEDDQGGTRGGRRYWRTGPHDRAGHAGLDALRHRVAWSRIVAWARARRGAAVARLGDLHTPRPIVAPVPLRVGSEAPADRLASPGRTAGASFRQMFEAAGGGPLLEAWGR